MVRDPYWVLSHASLYAGYLSDVPLFEQGKDNSIKGLSGVVVCCISGDNQVRCAGSWLLCQLWINHVWINHVWIKQVCIRQARLRRSFLYSSLFCALPGALRPSRRAW